MAAAFLPAKARTRPTRMGAAALLLWSAAAFAPASAQAPAPGDTGISAAVSAWKAGDYATARRIAEPLAARGQADAGFVLGHLYENGLGVARDVPQAVQYYVAAASAGQPNAQFALGELAYNGSENVVLDWERAAQWYNLAAAKGHMLAKVRLGYMYQEGQSVPQDLSRAASLYEEAAAGGTAVAQYYLGLLYLQGEGRPRDFKAAAKWFEAAAQQGDADSMYNLALLLEAGRAGDNGEADVDGAVYWMRQAAEQAVLPAIVSMGLLYYNGRGVPQSNTLAAEWFLQAAEGGSPEGMFLYAVGISEGITGDRDLTLALQWAERALAASSGEAPEVLEERRALRDQLRRLVAREQQATRAPVPLAQAPTPQPMPKPTGPQRIPAPPQLAEAVAPTTAPPLPEAKTAADTEAPQDKPTRRRLRR